MSPKTDIESRFSELHSKYITERDKRLHTDGVEQYVEMEQPFIGDIDDPYTERRLERSALVEEVDVIIVGAGFSGLLQADALLKQGITNFYVIEKGGDVGGTWYWNRYPGCRCDVDSYTYLPLIEEYGEMPAERYSRANDILDHARRIAQRAGISEKTILQTVDHPQHSRGYLNHCCLNEVHERNRSRHINEATTTLSSRRSRLQIEW